MLENIRKDIEKLIALYESERETKRRLQAELENSRSLNEAYRKQITDLERQVDNLKLTEAFVSPGGSDSAAREKIEKLIREIDKCISLLER